MKLVAKAIANIGCSQQVLRMGRIVFYSLAQFAHVSSQVFDMVFELSSPYCAQYLLVGDGPALIAHQ